MTRVLIVDDHPVFRDGLAGLLATLPDVEVTGTAGTAEEALTALQENAPDVVLMDINLPGASGVEATRRAAQIAPATAVLVVTMVDDDDSVFAALAAGARGYILKGASAGEITAALRTVAAGGAVFGAGIASRAPGQDTDATVRPSAAILARSDRTGTRGARPARRRSEQPPNRSLPRSLPQDSAEPRVTHPRQAPGHRPDTGRPASQGHLAVPPLRAAWEARSRQPPNTLPVGRAGSNGHYVTRRPSAYAAAPACIPPPIAHHR